jgi:lipopolysaccharide transport system permease protein
MGAAWTVLQPLAMITVYTVVFSQLMQTRLPGVNDPFAYSIYLCAGLLTWGLFAEIVQRCQTVFLDNGNMIKKLSFPRICLPTIVVSSALVNFAITFTVFMLFLLISGHFPSWVVFAMIPLLLFHVMFRLNPLTPFAQAYQGIFVNGSWPAWSTLWPSVVLALVLCVFALSLFRNRSAEMVDEL